MPLQKKVRYIAQIIVESVEELEPTPGSLGSRNDLNANELHALSQPTKRSIIMSTEVVGQFLEELKPKIQAIVDVTLPDYITTKKD
jgi:hypothetical protein